MYAMINIYRNIQMSDAVVDNDSHQLCWIIDQICAR